MDKVRYLINEAKKNLRTADHLVYMTYPLIKDPKLITSITENLHRSLIYTIEAIVRYDQLFRKIPVTTNMSIKLEQFRKSCVPRHKINKDIITIIDLLSKSKKETDIRESLVRRDFYSKSKNLSYEQLKKMDNTAKEFLLQIQNIITRW